MKFLPLLWAGIWRKPGRTVLAVVQILLVFALFGMLQGFSSYTRQAIANIDADLLSVHSRGSLFKPSAGRLRADRAGAGCQAGQFRQLLPGHLPDSNPELPCDHHRRA